MIAMKAAKINGTSREAAAFIPAIMMTNDAKPINVLRATDVFCGVFIL
jgi:hypothetical protein